MKTLFEKSWLTIIAGILSSIFCCSVSSEEINSLDIKSLDPVSPLSVRHIIQYKKNALNKFIITYIILYLDFFVLLYLFLNNI